ncbi:DUF1634 domain-containing protein [Nakamurella aerolata]|uniref:DUF1634 domain-containing protein n=1 Tax=Nakamurella aerolata TaxID=1656892 RepID=A0A849AEF3_9ACTN|nr:DUF1634 domain-containing protein [Nakamurella aerolata]NNG36840.1 DUF1634 domain-containing protein [Nakamurella aerolata]
MTDFGQDAADDERRLSERIATVFRVGVALAAGLLALGTLLSSGAGPGTAPSGMAPGTAASDTAPGTASAAAAAGTALLIVGCGLLLILPVIRLLMMAVHYGARRRGSRVFAAVAVLVLALVGVQRPSVCCTEPHCTGLHCTGLHWLHCTALTPHSRSGSRRAEPTAPT